MPELHNMYEQFFILCKWFCIHILRVRSEDLQNCNLQLTVSLRPGTSLSAVLLPFCV
jgi:hypothetical protein